MGLRIHHFRVLGVVGVWRSADKAVAAIPGVVISSAIITSHVCCSRRRGRESPADAAARQSPRSALMRMQPLWIRPSRMQSLHAQSSLTRPRVPGRWAGVKSVDRAVEKVVRSYGQVRTGDGARDDSLSD